MKSFSYPVTKNVVSEETSATMRMILEQVVESGSGKNGYVEGARVGGKTATSQTLPRGSGKYIASFLGFAPADNPKVLVCCQCSDGTAPDTGFGKAESGADGER